MFAIKRVSESAATAPRAIGIERVHFAGERSVERRRSLAGADQKSATFQKVLSHRHVEEAPRQLGLVLVVHVLGHADNLQPLVFYFKSLTDRILSRPIFCGHGFIDHSHWHGVLVIGAFEFATGDNWNTQSFEI